MGPGVWQAMPVVVAEEGKDEAGEGAGEDVRLVSIPVGENESCRAVVSGSLSGAKLTILTCCGVKGGTRGPLVDGPGKEGLYDSLSSTRSIAIVQLEYRKAGSSQFAGNIGDAKACLDWIVANGATRVGVVGHSQGGAVAFQVAAQRSSVVRGVCALASQTKGVPPSSSMRSLVEDCAMSVHVLHGDQDEILSAQCGKDIASRCGYGKRGKGAKGSIELAVVRGADHQFAGQGAAVKRVVESWMHRLSTTTTFQRRGPDPGAVAGVDAYAASKENDRQRRSPQKFLNFIFVADEVLDDAPSTQHGVADARRAVDALRMVCTNSAAAASGNGHAPDERDAIDEARSKAAAALRAAGLDGDMRKRLRRDKPARHALLHHVFEGLYCGGWAALNNDCEVLRQKRVTHVVSVVSADEPRKLGPFVRRPASS